jgi:hypothetical protein
MEVFLILFFLPGPIVFIDFLLFLAEGRRFIRNGFLGFMEILLLILFPIVFLLGFDYHLKNDCCRGGALFSPAHRLTIYVFIAICLLAYFYSGIRSKIGPPLVEIFVNATLLLAIVLNVFISIHVDESIFWIFGNVPIIILFIYRLVDNHRMLMEGLVQNDRQYNSRTIRAAWYILNLKAFKKIPLLLILALPVLVFGIVLLTLFGQRPDSFILAFTDTYRHGLSQLDCSNVTCPDGHFLCTIAANGHKKFVKPLRAGVRQDLMIKVNRQLLVSNAFEDLLAEKLPGLHKPVRRLYNVVGGNCKKLYDTLGNKWIADIVYLLMKPVEWMFVICLYLFDTKPENRIAKQYVYNFHRSEIDKRRDF